MRYVIRGRFPARDRPAFNRSNAEKLIVSRILEQLSASNRTRVALANLKLLSENGDVRYWVNERIVSLDQGWSLQNAAKEELFVIRPAWMHMQPTFEVVAGESIVATVTYEAGLQPWWRVERHGAIAMSIQPNYWRTRFDYVNASGRVALLTRPFLPFRSTTLDILDERIEQMVVALSVAVLKTQAPSRGRASH